FMATGTSFKQQCPSCEAMVPIRDPGLIGRKIDCPKCKYRFVVEEPEGDDEDAKPDKKKAGDKGKAGAKGPSKAGPRRRGEDEDDRPSKKKKGGGSMMLILGGGLAVVAVVAIVVAAVMFSGGDGSSSNSPSNPGNPSSTDPNAAANTQPGTTPSGPKEPASVL